ncbi:hypothetical protein [Micromonospora sp. RP3T]|uniref:hypothetical protein n=1 Tax=Micromonospora sp. RP3T TaxID=2135446 RepID=UPI003D729F52
MNISWSPGMRDSGIVGLGALLQRPEWRNSSAGPDITAAVTAALDDDSPLVRLHAARRISALYAGSSAAELAATIGRRALTETDRAVRVELIDQLGAALHDGASAVDSILELLLETETGFLKDVSDDLGTATMALLTYLACVPQTPFAVRAIHRWCEQAPHHPTTAAAFVRHGRDYLKSHGKTEQKMAFRLLNLAAQSCLARWTADPAEHLSDADLTPEQLAQLRGAVEVTHEISQQIYFASDAFEHSQGHESVPLTMLKDFAALAFPVLLTCTKLREAQTIHHAVETLVYLAGLDESRALRAVADAIPAKSSYNYDPQAGRLAADYLTRLLTEQRALILEDSHGVDAFRHLLQTFAAAGDQQALAMAYTFADIFR